MRIDRVDKIFSDGRHNAFTSIDIWKGKYYIVFRSADSHAAPHEGSGNEDMAPGHITLLESEDARSWSSSVVMDTKWDDRDPKLLATRDRLYVFDTCLHGEGYRDGSQETLVSYTEDGRDWSSPVSAYQYNYGFWKPKKHADVCYVAADVDDSLPGAPMAERGRVELLRSEDGLHWQPVSIITQGNRCTETSLVFLKDDSLLAINRQSTLSRILSISRPPYTQWARFGVKSSFGIQGPAAELVGDTVVVSCRVHNKDFPDEQPGEARTGLFILDMGSGALRWQTNLPTQWGCDVSYAGILPVGDDRALVSYYDGQMYEEGVPKQSDIMLATIEVR